MINEDRLLNQTDADYDFVRVYHKGPRRDAYKIGKYGKLLTLAGLTPGGSEKKRSLYYGSERLPHETTLWLKDAIRKKSIPLKVVSCESRWGRGTRARSRYLKYNKPGRDGTYRCAYCGARLHKDRIQVDHVISVSALTHRQTACDLAAILGITRSDSPKNLVATCPSCNRKKDTKAGGWLTLAALGRTGWFWPVIKTTFIAVTVAALAWAGYMGFFA